MNHHLLYQDAIKQLAAEAQHTGVLPQPDAEALRDNPLCGDRVHLMLRLHVDVVTALTHETKGCLLCRASATLLARHARKVSMNREGALALRDAVQIWLRTQADLPAQALDWRVFAPVRPHTSRHGCVLLPLEALAEAVG